MLLTIDVGNTQTVLGLFEETDARPPLAHLHQRRAHVGRAGAARVRSCCACGASSSIPSSSASRCRRSCPACTAALREMTEEWFGVKAVVLEPGTRTGMPILYDNPKEVGADRIANAVGAFDLYGGPCIVVDFGTATTFDAISAKGEYLGGAIIPGIEISLDALFARAAALRRVELVEPRNVIGKNTVESLQSGAVLRLRRPGRRPVHAHRGRAGRGDDRRDRRAGRAHHPAQHEDRAPRAVDHPRGPAHHLGAQPVTTASAAKVAPPQGRPGEEQLRIPCPQRGAEPDGSGRCRCRMVAPRYREWRGAGLGGAP